MKFFQYHGSNSVPTTFQRNLINTSYKYKFSHAGANVSLQSYTNNVWKFHINLSLEYLQVDIFQDVDIDSA